MEVRLLGPVEVVGDDGTNIGLGGPKVRALLAMLAIHGGQVISHDRLVDALWSEVPPPRTATRTLQSYLSRLRRVLSQASATGPAELVAHPGGWALRLAAGSLDVDRAAELAETGRAAAVRDDHLGAALAFGEALRAWRGRPLAEFADQPWAALEVGRLEEFRLGIVEQRIDAELACGRHRELVGELEAICRAHPLRYQPWVQRLIALYRSGRQGEALRVYQELRTTLRDELGIEPSPALSRLERRILSQDPSLDWPPVSGTGSPAF